jgi:hypothetical protein
MQTVAVTTVVIVALLAWPIAMYTGTVSYLIAFCVPFAVAAVVADDLKAHSAENG